MENIVIDKGETLAAEASSGRCLCCASHLDVKVEHFEFLVSGFRHNGLLRGDVRFAGVDVALCAACRGRQSRKRYSDRTILVPRLLIWAVLAIGLGGIIALGIQDRSGSAFAILALAVALMNAYFLGANFLRTKIGGVVGRRSTRKGGIFQSAWVTISRDEHSVAFGICGWPEVRGATSAWPLVPSLGRDFHFFLMARTPGSRWEDRHPPGDVGMGLRKQLRTSPGRSIGIF